MHIGIFCKHKERVLLTSENDWGQLFFFSVMHSATNEFAWKCLLYCRKCHKHVTRKRDVIFCTPTPRYLSVLCANIPQLVLFQTLVLALASYPDNSLRMKFANPFQKLVQSMVCEAYYQNRIRFSEKENLLAFYVLLEAAYSLL